MKFVVSPHTHTESFLTASTLANLINRAKELGRTHFAVTDNGHLSSAFKAYSMAKKAGLKPILGIEAYFKDESIPELTSVETKKCKYFTISVYAHDQEAYQEIVKIASKTDLHTIEIHEETQNLWTWQELEHISKFNISVVLGGIHDLVGKTLLANKPEVGGKIFQKLKELYNDKLYVSILAEPWTKKWQNVIKIEYVDGTHSSVLSKDMVSTDKAKRIKAIDLTEKKHHERVKSITSGGIYSTIEKVINKSTLHSGFLPLPGGDASLKVNKFLYALANRYGIKVLVTDYAYYAHKEDKIVQTMVLEGKNKLQPNLHMKTDEEIASYLVSVMGITQEYMSKLLSNNEEWAKGFDGFNLKYEWRLAEVEGDKTAIQKIIEIVKASGRIKWDDPRYVARLKEEIEVIHKNGIYDLSPYFLPIRDVLNYYKENGELPGCGRGSSGASLICYGLGITQLDPIKWDLPFQRFFSMTRIKQRKLPDIDCIHEGSEINTDKGIFTIKELSEMDVENYPAILCFDGQNNIYEKPLLIFKKNSKTKMNRYTMEDGNHIICTPDHKVYTEMGWMEIEEAFRQGMDIKMLEFF